MGLKLNPEIKNHSLFHLSQPGTPPLKFFLSYRIYFLNSVMSIKKIEVRIELPHFHYSQFSLLLTSYICMVRLLKLMIQY